jgi:ribosomal protein S18 acetylase RimI-like enzyme
MHWNYPQEWLSHWLSDLRVSPGYIEEHAVYKMTLADEVIGFMAIEEKTDWFEISHLWILPAHLGKGYGQKLLKEVVRLVVRPGAMILVEADPHAESFYRRQGFETFDQKESYPIGRFLPVMKKMNAAPAASGS